jgi:hypothetical protein
MTAEEEAEIGRKFGSNGVRDQLKAELAALKADLAAAQAGSIAMHTAVGELLGAIDAVESEPGRSGAPIFAVDWRRTMELVRDLPDTTCLEQFVEAALRDGNRFVDEVERIATKHGFQTAEGKGNLLAWLDLALRARNTLAVELPRKLDDLAERFKALERDRDEKARQLRAVKMNVDGVWRWQPDGGNFPETMSPGLAVVMTADTLLAFVAVRTALEERGCQKGKTVDACLDSRDPCETCAALGACPV